MEAEKKPVKKTGVKAPTDNQLMMALAKSCECTKSELIAALMWAVEGAKADLAPGENARVVAFAAALRKGCMENAGKRVASAKESAALGRQAASDLLDARTAAEYADTGLTLAQRCEALTAFFAREAGRGKEIRAALLQQLRDRKMDTPYTIDLVETYMDMWALCELAAADIGEKGNMITYNNGGGQMGAKPNPSCDQLVKTNKQMMSILDKLGIVIPAAPPGAADEAEDDDP